MEIFNNEYDADTSEYNLIKRFFQILNQNQPDIITGYNIFGFDEDYIFKRAEFLC
jgi:DNA polymerase elongation subunit (family B)